MKCHYVFASEMDMLHTLEYLIHNLLKNVCGISCLSRIIIRKTIIEHISYFKWKSQFSAYGD